MIKKYKLKQKFIVTHHDGWWKYNAGKESRHYLDKWTPDWGFCPRGTELELIAFNQKDYSNLYDSKQNVTWLIALQNISENYLRVKKINYNNIWNNIALN